MAHELIFFNGTIVGFIIGGLVVWKWARHIRKACLKKHLRSNSQSYSVMNHICNQGKTLNKDEAKAMFQVTNLPSIISSLNKSGSEIRTVRSRMHGTYYSL